MISPDKLDFISQLSVPAIAAPMFLVSNPKMVINTCVSGMIGSFPALNQRTNADFESWLEEISTALTAASESDAASQPVAPYAVNLIVHKTNKRLEDDLKSIVKYKVPVVITSLGINTDVIDAVHSYGGLVFHDVAMSRHAIKAAKSGVDGLILVCAGAGGHAGLINPFAFVGEVRKLFGGTLILSGCISSGADIAAARAMGADLAYMGTRFIATNEASVKHEYKQMVVDSTTKDILYTDNISGIHANFLRPSLVNNGIDPDTIEKPQQIDLGEELTASEDASGNKESGAWKDLWSAGQGVGSIDDVIPVAELVTRLRTEYRDAIKDMQHD